MEGRWRGTPATWIWTDCVPTYLQPFENQVYVVVGLEYWSSFPYVLLDWKDPRTDRVACRYACWVIQYWGGAGGWTHLGPSRTPPAGWTLIADEVKHRPRKGDFLLRLNWGLTDQLPQWNVFYIMSMHGCYIPSI